jgi:hypothetical protein
MREQETVRPEIQRELEDFASLYANNVVYEASVWDLKLIFGQLDQKLLEPAEGKTVTVDYHTAITLPWEAIKLMIYYLRANLATHEIESGPIKLPDRVLPPQTPLPLPEDIAAKPQAKAAAEANQRIWEEEFGSNNH